MSKMTGARPKLRSATGPARETAGDRVLAVLSLGHLQAAFQAPGQLEAVAQVRTV